MLTCSSIKTSYIPMVCCCYAAEKMPNENQSEVAETLVFRTNEERTRRGLTKLEVDDAVSQAASIRASEQRVQFSHTRPNGMPYYTVFSQIGIGGTNCGENLARCQTWEVEQIFQAWMNSEGHRANILNPGFTKIGISYVESNGIGYFCQLFTN